MDTLLRPAQPPVCAKSALLLDCRDVGPTRQIVATRHTRLRCALKALAAVAVALTLTVSASAPNASAQSATLDALRSPAWLAHLNDIRSCAGLPAVTEDAVLSRGAWLHARYMSENGYIGHSEDPSRPFFSAEGLRAAASSNCSLGRAGLAAIDGWATGPFHLLGMLNPRLRTAGFGSYAAEGKPEAAALDVIRGLGGVPQGVRFPIAWPGPGATVPFTAYSGGEYPDPLASTGLRVPSGLPIVVQFGTGSVTPIVTESELRVVGGGELEHVVLTEATYRNGDADAQQLGREILGGRDAVVLVPREPLLMGRTYQVTLVCLGQRIEWTFRTGAEISGAAGQDGGESDEASESASASLALENLGAPVIAGSAHTLRGRVSMPALQRPSAATVRLESQVGATWQPCPSAPASLSPAGEFSFTIRPSARTAYRAVLEGVGTARGCVSTPVVVTTRATLPAPTLRPSTVAGGRCVVRGKILPAHAAVIALEFECVGGARRGSTLHVRVRSERNGAYGLALRLAAGTWQVRSVHADAGHVRSVSAKTRARVR